MLAIRVNVTNSGKECDRWYSVGVVLGGNPVYPINADNYYSIPTNDDGEPDVLFTDQNKPAVFEYVNGKTCVCLAKFAEGEKASQTAKTNFEKQMTRKHHV